MAPSAISPTWFEHVDVMQLIIVLLFSAFIWFCIRTLRSIDANQKEMFSRLTTLERDFYTLKGEHKAHHNGNGKEDA